MRIRILLRAGAGPGAGRSGQAGRLAPVLSVEDPHRFNPDTDPDLAFF
jgi:hypothetical protein